MNYKFKTLEWWFISLWFVAWGILSVLLIFSKPIPPINYTILIAGFSMLIYCAWNEDQLFPPEPPGEEEP